MQSPLFPPGYPSELKKYGYPPPFPPGYPPESYEKYGYPPRQLPSEPENHHDRKQSSASLVKHKHENRSTRTSNEDDDGYPIPSGIFPWGAGNYYIPIAGNVYNSGFNLNHSGSQSNGSVKVANQNTT